MSEKKEMRCPVCGEGILTKNGEKKDVKSLRTRASWTPPFPRKGTAWFYKSKLETPATRVHGVVESVSFGKCGRNDNDLGLSLGIQLEHRSGCSWIFYNYGDIAEFFDRAKAQKLNDLIGTPVIIYESLPGGAGCDILGIDIIDSLVLSQSRRRNSH